MPFEKSPCVNQTEAEIATYYGSANVGDEAMVRQTQGHVLYYTLAKITGFKPERGRVYVDNFGAFYTKHGRNCFHPKGQTTLVVPTPEIRAWMKANPTGKMNVSVFS